MKIEIREIEVIHEELGTLTKQIIVYLTDEGVEITRENYTVEHPLYGIDPTNLTRMDKFIISQMGITS